MPIYEYEILDERGAVRGIYEAEQRMSEPALVRHPVTGEPLRRILSRTFTHGFRASTTDDCSTGTCGVSPCAGGACGWG